MVVLIKLGALAMQLDHARAFMAKIREVTSRYRVVLFPGGGIFADLIRKIDQEHDIGDDAAHWLAIHAMDSMGIYLASTSPGLREFTQFSDLKKYLTQLPHFVGDGLPEVPIWLPYAWCRHTDPTPHSWDVTSDSLAIIAGASLGVEWVGLAKATENLSKDHPFSASPLLKAIELEHQMNASKMPRIREDWAVDPYLPRAITVAKVSCRVFDGRDLPNLVSLLSGKGNSKFAEILP